MDIDDSNAICRSKGVYETKRSCRACSTFFIDIDLTFSSHPNDCKVHCVTMASQLMNGVSLPAFKCPSGTKMHILNLGTLQVDEGW